MSPSSRARGRAVIVIVIGATATVLLGLLGCGLLGRATTRATPGARGTPPPSAIYTPLVLRQGVAQDRAAWLGRVVWVRARAVLLGVTRCLSVSWCVIRQPTLADPVVDAAAARLPFLSPAENRLVTWARRIPLWGRLVPPAHPIAWYRVALYHIRLTAAPSCGDPRCVMALLVAPS